MLSAAQSICELLDAKEVLQQTVDLVLGDEVVMAVVVMMVMMSGATLARVRLAPARPVMVMVGMTVGMGVVMAVSVVMVGGLRR